MRSILAYGVTIILTLAAMYRYGPETTIGLVVLLSIGWAIAREPFRWEREYQEKKRREAAEARLLPVVLAEPAELVGEPLHHQASGA